VTLNGNSPSISDHHGEPKGKSRKPYVVLSVMSIASYLAFFPQRAAAAFLAIPERCFAVSFSIRAFVPIFPPLEPAFRKNSSASFVSLLRATPQA
jgi:hypothetical protein